MMRQQTYASTEERTHEERAQPRRRDVFLHVGKTFKLIGRLMMDRRVAVWRKLLFVITIGILLAILLFPDFFNEVFLSTILPVIGTIAGVPIDAGFDWLAFAFVGV